MPQAKAGLFLFDKSIYFTINRMLLYRLRNTVGTKIKVLTKIGPIKLNDFMTFTKWEEKKSIGVDHIGIVTGKGEMQFEKVDENITKFKWIETLTFPLYFGGPIGEIIGKPIMKLIWKENLKNLKKEIEK